MHTKLVSSEMNNKELTTIYFSSDSFAEQCGVSITSLFENNKKFDSITVYILEDNISEINKGRLQQLADNYNREISFITMPKPEEYWNDSRFNIDNVGHTFGRMIVGDILPKNLHRVLCLDSDLIILDSLEDLWNEDIDDCYIAGILNGVGDKVLTKLLDAPVDMPYFNGGVYLINLDLIRKDFMEKKYLEYMRDIFAQGRTLGAYEEEVMNKCCFPKVKTLSPRYNLMPINLVMSYDEFIKFRGTCNFYSRDEMDEAIKHPAIIHVANLFYLKSRVWEAGSEAPYADVYRRYKSISPWKDCPPIEAKRSLRNRVIKEAWHLLPRSTAFAIAAFVRNDVRPHVKKKRDDI